MENILIGEGADEQNLANNKIGELLIFYGVVRDDGGLEVEDALVMVFACFSSGFEKPLGHAITGKDGRYIVSIPKPSGFDNLSGYKVRAGKPYIVNRDIDCPVVYQTEPDEELELDTKVDLDIEIEPEKDIEPDADQGSIIGILPGQDGTAQGENEQVELDQVETASNPGFSILSEDEDNVVDPDKAGEREYYRQPPEGGNVIEAEQARTFDVLPVETIKEPEKKFEKVFKMSDLIPTALLVCSAILLVPGTKLTNLSEKKKHL